MKKKLWGGRFRKRTNPLVDEFTKSIGFDKKLAEYDCISSLYHIAILKKAGILTAKEYNRLKKGLEDIIGSIRRKSFRIDDSFEDIHSYIQYLLEKKVGKLAFKLHTARSRNEQVIFDTKCYCLAMVEDTMKMLKILNKSLSDLAIKNKNIYIPGYTHLQHAMPIDLADYFKGYSDMFSRDIDRMKSSLRNIKLTMGAGAIAGTIIDSSSYNICITSLLSARKLSPLSNSIDSVSDRDFVIEILSSLSIVGMHLSRLSEDLILWSTKEFDFIDIDETFCTGSSLMPQKKNPDVLELIRGYSGRLYANLLDVLVVMKALPLGYNRDMQLDKEPLFSSFEIVQKELKVLTGLLPNITFKKETIQRQLEDECLYATDMVDCLVRKGIAFKDAHRIIGKLIDYKLKSSRNIKDLSDEKLKEFHLTNEEVKRIIDPEASVRSKRSVKRN